MADALREASRNRPQDDYLRTFIAHTASVRGEAAEAEVLYREVARRVGYKDWLAWRNLVNSLTNKGDVEGAEAVCREQIRIRSASIVAHGPNAEAVLRSFHGELARILLKSGRFAEAREELGPAPKQSGLLLQCERGIALSPRLLAILKGEDRPRDASERLAFAQFCYNARCYQAAARFWGEALEADPKLGDDCGVAATLRRRLRAAAAARRGKGKDAPPPDGDDRAKLRARALAWLRAERDAWAEVIETANRQARIGVASTVGQWQYDGDLAGVREPEALAKLPEAERKDWQALWDDVALLKRRALATSGSR